MSVTLKNFNFGKAEAEAENTKNNYLLTEVFDDYLGIMKKIENDDRFLIIGRKGVGKSALAQYYNFEYSEQVSTFSSFINTQKISINNLIHLGKELNEKYNLKVDSLLIFQWIILVSLCNQLRKNEGVKGLPCFKDLERFFSINSGFVSLGGQDIEETILKHKGNINFEPLNNFFKANLGGEITSEKRSVKAPFYTLIPSLEKVAKFLLNNEFNSGNKYRVIFDDLDVLFKEDDSLPLLAQVLRLIKDYNTSTFNSPNTDVSVLVFIRPDQLSKLSYEPDIMKLVSSYGVNIRWYTQDSFNHDENDLPLKKFTTDRLKKTFETNGFSTNYLEAWDSLINSEDFNRISSFKYVLDRTMYRPRDIINLLNTLKEKFPEKMIPISKSFLDKAIEEFSSLLGEEIKNELVMTFEKEEIESIFKCLRELPGEFSQSDFLNLLNCNDDHFQKIISELYKYGVIGIKTGKVMQFIHWGLDYDISNDSSIVKHHGLTSFLSKKRKSLFW